MSNKKTKIKRNKKQIFVSILCIALVAAMILPLLLSF